MIVYNITFCIDRNALDGCLDYITKRLVPRILSDGRLSEPRLCHVRQRSDMQDEGSESYALQFEVQSIELLNEWLSGGGESFLVDMARAFENRVVGFSTILENVPLS